MPLVLNLKNMNVGNQWNVVLDRFPYGELVHCCDEHPQT
jgi:hypothetical protein